MVLILAGCSASKTAVSGSPQAKVTAAPIPSGWQVFHESRFTVAVPAAWTTFTGKIAQNSQADFLALAPGSSGGLLAIRHYSLRGEALRAWVEGLRQSQIQSGTKVFSLQFLREPAGLVAYMKLAGTSGEHFDYFVPAGSQVYALDFIADSEQRVFGEVAGHFQPA